MKKSRILGILSTVTFTLFIVWMMIFVNAGTLPAVIDFYAIVGLFICIPMLWTSGYLKDFVNALKITFCDCDLDEKELKRADKSCSFLLRILWIEAFLFTLVNFLGFLNEFEDKNSFGTSIALSLLPIFYALILSFFIFLIKAFVEREI